MYFKICLSLPCLQSHSVDAKESATNLRKNFNGSNTFGNMKICSKPVVRANECEL